MWRILCGRCLLITWNAVHLHVLTHIQSTRTSILQHIHWTSCHCLGHHDIDMMFFFMRPLSHQDTLVPWSCLSKNNAISAHSPTFFSVAFPPSCNMSLHGCWNVVDRKRGHANMHLIIPLRPRAMSRPGHALRLVEEKKRPTQIHSYTW